MNARRASAARKFPEGGWQRFATLGSVLTAAGALMFTGLTYSAGRDQDQQNHDAQLVNRFSTATTQLGAGTVEERIGGIYALKRLAADSSRDRRTVYEVLAGFIRSRSSITSVGGIDACRTRTYVEADVQAALDALATRAESGSGGLGVVDLHETCLASARFEGADFTNADMSGAVLAGARITGKVTLRLLPDNGDLHGPTQFLDELSDFTGANLTGADLSGLQVMGAIFKNALLGHVDMRDISRADFGGGAVYPARDSKVITAGSKGERVQIALAGEITPFQLGLFLDGAYLEHANFAGTNLGDTSFRGANLLCADFTDAEIGDAWFEGVWAMSDAEVREILKSHPVPCK